MQLCASYHNYSEMRYTSDHSSFILMQLLCEFFRSALSPFPQCVDEAQREQFLEKLQKSKYQSLQEVVHACLHR